MKTDPRSSKSIRWILLAVVVMLGCERQPPPKSIRLEFPNVLVSSDPASVLVHLTNAEGATTRGTEEYDFAVSPPELATVSRRGVLTCQKSGDGKLTVTVASVTQAGSVRCRLVERLDTTGATTVELAQGPFVPKIRVLGKGDEELSDVELSLTSRTPGVIVPRGQELQPKDVGTATIVARAGQVVQEFTIDVVRRLTPEALPIDGNRKIHYSLGPGKYRLAVNLPNPRPLSVEWRGAPYCNYSATEREHASTCVLRTKGGAVFDNPAYLLHGSTDVSVEGVSLYEVP